jgi:hypothetical protein
VPNVDCRVRGRAGALRRRGLAHEGANHLGRLTGDARAAECPAPAYRDEGHPRIADPAHPPAYLLWCMPRDCPFRRAQTPKFMSGIRQPARDGRIRFRKGTAIHWDRPVSAIEIRRLLTAHVALARARLRDDAWHWRPIEFLRAHPGRPIRREQPHNECRQRQTHKRKAPRQSRGFAGSPHCGFISLRHRNVCRCPVTGVGVEL